MKKSLLLLLLPLSLYGQNTVVSSTMTDTDGVAWAGAMWKIDFRPGPSNPNESGYRLLNGQPLATTVTHQTGSANASGQFSFTIYDSTLIVPTGSGWTLTLCSTTSAPCGTYQFTTAGSSMDISSRLTTAIAAPRFAPGNNAYGYADVEVQVSINQGSTYWNVLSNVMRIWNGIAWSSIGSGAVAVGNPNEVQINNAGAFGAASGVVYDGNGGLVAANGGLAGKSVGGSCYAKQWATPPGTGTNGIANAMANCSTVIADATYTSGDTFAQSNMIQTPRTLMDQRGTATTTVYRNPSTDANGNFLTQKYGLPAITGFTNLCTWDMSPTAQAGNFLNQYCNYLGLTEMTPGWDQAFPVFNGILLNIWHLGSSQGQSSTVSVQHHGNAPGDQMGGYFYLYSQGGRVMGNSEGSKWMTGATVEENNSFEGSVLAWGAGFPAGTSTNPTSVVTNPNGSMIASAYAFGLGAGRYAIPLSCSSYPGTCAAAPFTGIFSSVSPGLDNAGSSLNVVPATGTITPSIAYGTLNADVPTPASLTPPLFSTTQIVTVNIEGGTNGTSSLYTTTSLACFDGSYHECAYPTAVSPANTPAAGQQQVTMPLRRSHSHTTGNPPNGTSHLWQGGMAGTCFIPTAYVNIPVNASGSQPMRYCYDVFGARILTGTITSVSTGSGTGIYTGTGLASLCPLPSTTTQVTISGLPTGANNGTFICVSATATSLTVWNPLAVADPGPDSGTATLQVLQVGRFELSNMVPLDGTLQPVQFLQLSTTLSSSGTTVTANGEIFNGGFHPQAGQSILISNSQTMDGQCNNVQFVAGSTTTFTCQNPNLTGTHTTTSTNPRAQLVNTTCYQCNATTAGKALNSYEIRPAAEVLDVRNVLVATQFSLASNVLTLTLAASNGLNVGTQIFLSGFSTGTYLNNNVATIATTTPIVTATMPAGFSHADVPSTTDTGALVIQPPSINGTLTLESNIFGTLSTASTGGAYNVIEELHHPSAQFQGFVNNDSANNPIVTQYNDLFSMSFGGAGVNGNTLMQTRNSNPDSWYIGNGGVLNPPQPHSWTGALSNLYSVGEYPTGAYIVGLGQPFQYNNPNFTTSIINLFGKATNANSPAPTAWTYNPSSGDMNQFTNGAFYHGASVHYFNGPVDNLTSDSGFAVGMAVNYAPNSNAINLWGGAGSFVTCTITDDLGNPACTIATTGGLNLSDSLASYTPLTLGIPYTIQARAKGNVGGEQVTFALNNLASALDGTTGVRTLTTTWTNYCVPFLVSRGTLLNTGAQINQSTAQTIMVSNVVVRPGSSCGPWIQTGANQVLTPTAVNHFPGTPLKVSSSLTPTAVSPNSCLEETFSITGSALGQVVSVSPPSSMVAGDVWIGYARVTAAGTVAIEFCTSGAGATPPAGTYIFSLL